MESSMGLGRLQQNIEKLYDVETSCDIEQFLITDPQVARDLDASDNARELAEKLIIRQEEGSLDLGLYLQSEVVKKLEKDDPVEALHPENLHPFWLALEGVSHFVYLIWNSRHARQITLFDLELQGEIDKYVAAALLLRMQNGSHVSENLFEILFENPRFDTRLNVEERVRYEKANSLAKRYCSRLRDTFLYARNFHGLVTELRRFYRMPRQKRTEYIQSVA